MKSMRRAGIAAAVIGMGVLALAQAATVQAANVAVTITPGSQSVTVGQTVTIKIGIANATNLAAYEFMLQYDPAVLHYIDHQDLGFLATTGRSVSCPNPAVDESIGQVHLGCSSTQYVPDGPSGDGALSEVHFTAAGEGSTDITFTKIELANPNGDDCCGPQDVTGAAIAVGSGSTPDVPPTPTPEQGRDVLRASTPPAGAQHPDYATLPDGGAAGSGGGPSAGAASPGGPGAPASAGPGASGSVLGAQGGSPAGGAGGASGAPGSGTSSNFPISGQGYHPDERHNTWQLLLASTMAGVGLMLLLGALGIEARRRQHRSGFR